MAAFSELLQNNPYTYVPLLPLLQPGFNMMFTIGQQKRAEANAAKAQKKADFWSGLGMAKDVGTTAATLGVLGGMGGLGGAGEAAGEAAGSASEMGISGFGPMMGP